MRSPEVSRTRCCCREGRVVASGPIEESLTAGTLSQCFGLNLVLEQRDGRWTARSTPG